MTNTGIIKMLKSIADKIKSLNVDSRPLSEKGMIVTYYIGVGNLSPAQADQEVESFKLMIRDTTDINDIKKLGYYREYFIPIRNEDSNIDIKVI